LKPNSCLLRPLRRDQDVDDIVELITECEAADRISTYVSATSISRDIVHEQATTVVAEVDGRAAAVGIVTAIGGGRYVAKGFVRPQFRRRGIGRLLSQTNERRARELAAARGEQGVLHAMAWQIEHAHRLLLFTEGFSQVRTIHRLVRPSLDDLPYSSPSDFVIRTPKPDEYARVLVALEEAFVDQWSGDADRLDTERDVEVDNAIKNGLFEPSLCLAAFDGWNVVGVLLGTRVADDGEPSGQRRVAIDKLSVRPSARRNGIGRQLLHGALHLFRYRDFDSVELLVDAHDGYGAQHLYESTGFELVSTSTLYEKPFRERQVPEAVLRTVTGRPSWPVPAPPPLKERSSVPPSA
jgi:ribosomal protein S18 acetylase RimI-like enzyme